MHDRPDLRWRRRKRWTVRTAAAVLLVASASPVSAFYWIGWPGSGVTPPPTIVSEVIKIEHPLPPPIITEPPGGGGTNPPTTVDPPTVEPKAVPEPATMLLGGVGLATMAGLRWVRKRRKPQTGNESGS